MEYGLIGEHLGHSWSAEIHAQIADYRYELRELAPSELGPFLKARDFKGLNVTIPYKEAVIPFLDELSPEAQAVGAVNTILHSDGKLTGHNTDYYGFSALAAHTGIEFSGKSVLILGAGGAAKAVRAVAIDQGASKIVNAVRHYSHSEIGGWGRVRRTAEYEGFQKQMGVCKNGKGGDADTTTDINRQTHCVCRSPYIECLYEDLKGEDYEIIVNATPVGMFPNVGGRLLNLNNYTNLCGVLDCVYNPERTLLVQDAHKRGLAAEGGLYMLVAQAVKASEIFTGFKYDQALENTVFKNISLRLQ